MRAWQRAGPDRYRTDGPSVASVDAGLAGQDLTADDLGLDVEEQVADVVLGVGIGVRSETFGFDLRRDFLEALLAGLLLAQRIRRAQIALGGRRDLGDHRFVLRRRLPVPERLARFLDQRVDQLDHRLLLLVSVDHSAEHHFLGEFFRFRFDHEHRGFGPGNHQVELGDRELSLGRVEHVLTIDIADARRADRAVEWNAGQADRRRGADQRGNVWIDLRITCTSL